jgi:hypothetical protein
MSSQTTFQEWNLNMIQFMKYVNADWQGEWKLVSNEPPLGAWYDSQVLNYNPDITQSTLQMQNPKIHAEWSDTIVWRSNYNQLMEYLAAGNQIPSRDHKYQHYRVWIDFNIKCYNSDITQSTEIMMNPMLHHIWGKSAVNPINNIWMQN